MTISITISGDTLDEVLGIAARLSQGTPPAFETPGTTPNMKTQEEEAAEYEAKLPKRRGRPPGKKADTLAGVNTEPVTIVDDPGPVETPVAPVDVATLRSTLIEVVKQKGRDACGELCRRYGGPNLSALNPAVYSALYADAQALLATDTP